MNTLPLEVFFPSRWNINRIYPWLFARGFAPGIAGAKITMTATGWAFETPNYSQLYPLIPIRLEVE